MVIECLQIQMAPRQGSIPICSGDSHEFYEHIQWDLLMWYMLSFPLVDAVCPVVRHLYAHQYNQVVSGHVDRLNSPMADEMDRLAYVRKDAVASALATCDFAKRVWALESYETAHVMWVQPMTPLSFQHAIFPLLQLSLCLTSSDFMNGFDMHIEDDTAVSLRASISERLLRTAYIVPTESLFRRLPALSEYISSWLSDDGAPTALWEIGSRSTGTYPYLCLAHTYDSTGPGRIGYSVRYCGDCEEYTAWTDELYDTVCHLAKDSPAGLTKLSHILMHTDTVILMRRLKNAVAGNFVPMGDPVVWLDLQTPDRQSTVASPLLDRCFLCSTDDYQDIDLSQLSDMELNDQWPHTVTIRTEPVEMNEDTYKVFEHFMSHQGDWFSDADLATHC
jgi:hypothetical protein